VAVLYAFCMGGNETEMGEVILGEATGLWCDRFTRLTAFLSSLNASFYSESEVLDHHTC